jgi:hypothetical protein
MREVRTASSCSYRPEFVDDANKLSGAIDPLAADSHLRSAGIGVHVHRRNTDLCRPLFPFLHHGVTVMLVKDLHNNRVTFAPASPTELSSAQDEPVQAYDPCDVQMAVPVGSAAASPRSSSGDSDFPYDPSIPCYEEAASAQWPPCE